MTKLPKAKSKLAVRLLAGSSVVAPILLVPIAAHAETAAASSSSATAQAASAAPLPPTTDSNDPNTEILVTATRRSESIQKVPISMQAIGEVVLKQRQITDADGFVKILPSVSYKSLGPGRSDLFFRGISTGSTGGSGLIRPAAGVYFDEVPITTNDRLMDVHLYDIARVEALAGPQGTLFGASSLSGTLRIISNKPDPSKFSAGYDLTGTKFGKGNNGGVAEGFANIPLSPNAAVRIVGYYNREGGYIDNKPGGVTYTRPYTNTNGQPATAPLVKTNAGFASDNYNSVTTYGGRIALGIDLDEQWSVTPTVMAQRQVSEGSFNYDPKVGDLAVHDYTPTRNDDRWVQAGLTIKGKIANMDLIYSGSYLDRHVLNDQDYTYYTVAYDSFPGYTYIPDGRGGLLDPTQRFFGDIKFTKQTHELRLSSANDKPFRYTVGGFYQRQTTDNSSNFYIPGLGATGSPMALVGDNVYLFDVTSIYRDYAAFAQAEYDVTPTVTLIAGIRGFYDRNTAVGFSGVPGSARRAGCAVPLTAPCVNITQETTESGETHKLGVRWQFDPRKMLYFTYSTGFRPGGANRIAGIRPYKPDTVDNFEVGIKATFFGNLRVNAAVYYERWKNMQYKLQIVGFNGSTALYNAGQADIKGIEADINWSHRGFTLSGAAAYTDGKIARDICNLDATFNQPASCTPGPATAVFAGTRLPNQPVFKGNLTARYDIPVGDIDAFVQGSLQGQTGTRSYLSDLEAMLLGNTSGFVTTDFSIGGSKGNTSVQIFIQNAFDRRGELSRNSFCAITICSNSARSYPIKPQFFGIKVGQRF